MDTAPSTTAKPRSHEMRDQLLVDPEWLEGHLHDPDLRVVEVDVSPAAYDDWHIDGAVLWNVYQDLKDPDYQPAPPAALEGLLARSGVTAETNLVFYGYAPGVGPVADEPLRSPPGRHLELLTRRVEARGPPLGQDATPTATRQLPAQRRRPPATGRAHRRRRMPSPALTRSCSMCARLLSTEVSVSGLQAARSRAGEPDTYRPRCISRSTGSTKATARSDRRQRYEVSSRRSTSTAATRS